MFGASLRFRVKSATDGSSASGVKLNVDSASDDEGRHEPLWLTAVTPR
jgi:hypothetical protein